MKSMFSEFDLNNFPWKFGTYHRTWKIPSEYFSSFKILSKNIYIPDNAIRYLEFRYGNWKVPTAIGILELTIKVCQKKSPDSFKCF